MDVVYILVVLILTVVHLNHVTCSTRQDTQTLQDRLFQNYNKDLGPNSNQSQPINLYMSFNLFTIKEFDDKAGKLSFLGYFTILWKDDRMVWDPVQYGNTTYLLIPQSKVWTPFLIIGRPYSEGKWLGNDKILLRYSSDGTAYWPVMDLLEVSCIADVSYYPVDRQLCEILIVPWGYQLGAFDIQLLFDSMTRFHFIENGIWNVLSTQMLSLREVEGDYVKMVIKFQRRPLFIVLNLLLPITVVGTLNVFIFLLPPEPGERSAFGVTVLLALAVFLSIISDKLPNTSEPHISRISIYLIVQLSISSVIMLFTMYGLVLHNNRENKPIPKWLKRLVPACSKRKERETIRTKSARNTEHTDESSGSGSGLSVRTDQYGRGVRNGLSRIDANYLGFNDKHTGYPNGHVRRGYSNLGTPNSDAKYSNHVYPNGDNQRFLKGQRGYRNREYPNMHKNNSRAFMPPRATSEESIAGDSSRGISWTDVGNLFDKCCLVFFIVIHLVVCVFFITDSITYLNSEF